MINLETTMPSRLLGLRASLVAVGLVVLLSVTLMTTRAAEDEMKNMEIAELTKSYDVIEAQLLRHFQEQKDSGSNKLSDTIKALGHIRSKKAVSLLIESIDIEPGAKTERVGEFYPVEITKARTLESVYVALSALERIGVPLDKCISEIEQSEGGGRREMLFTRLAHMSHGRAFLTRARDEKKRNPGKWVRVLKLSGEE